MNGTELRKQGRGAFDRGEWLESYEHLRVAVAGDVPLEPKDLEWLAIAAYLTGHDRESTDAWALAHHAWLDEGVYAQAVRCAFWAGFGLQQRGEMAQGGEWLARAGTLVSHLGLDCVERGYLLLPEALMAMGVGDVRGALDRFGEASELAQRFGDRDLAALGAIGRGEALLRLGRAPDGMRLFDEAMVSVTVGETSPAVAGIVYCAVIDACQQVFAPAPGQEWTAALGRWSPDGPRGSLTLHFDEGSVSVSFVEREFQQNFDPQACAAASTALVTSPSRAAPGRTPAPAGSWRRPREGRIIGARGENGECIGRSAPPKVVVMRVDAVGTASITR